MKVVSYKDLTVWQKSMDLTVIVYELVKKLPKDETYGLISQMKRAVVSIPLNISEGKNRSSYKDYAHFLTIAQGSKAELETLFEICLRLGFLSEEDICKALELLEEISKMLRILIIKLRKMGN